MSDPTVTIIVAVASAVAVLSIFLYLVQRRREAHDAAHRRDWLQQERRRSQVQRDEIERLAKRIIATSTTRTVAGFAIERQIEAVFTDGHPSPAEAVEALKAVAAEKGANALINLEGGRLGTGKCSARADAVIVRPLKRGPSVEKPPMPAEQSEPPPRE